MISATTIEKATLYEKYQLPYAEEIVGNLLGLIGKIEVIADIGAGTGQLVRMLAYGNRKVYAIEPDPAMRKVAMEALKGFPQIEIVAGCAEQTTLTANSIDLIVVGNASHRFKPEACAEFGRILKKQGWIALVSYTFTDKAFADMLFSKLGTLKAMTTRQEKAWPRTPIETLFGDNQFHIRSYPQSYVGDWTAFFGAACAMIETPMCTEQEFVQFEAINREIFDAFVVDGKIEIEYETNNHWS